MATILNRGLKRGYIDEKVDLLSSKKIKRLSLKYQNTFEYYCQVYLKFYPITYKCTIDVIVKSNNDIIEEKDSVLLGKSRIGKMIQPGVIRVRLVSSLFLPDDDVHEDPSMIKLEIIKKGYKNHFDKQFALKLKNNRIGPGVIGKLFIESLDPSNGSYRNEPPIFELNLSLPFEHQMISPSSYQNNENSLICGCLLTSDQSRLIISDQCNLKLNNMKLIHRLAELLRCQWKSLGRELSPCFSEIDLIDIYRTYFILDGNHECTYQLLREWFIRSPDQANIRYLLTRLKISFDIILEIHNNIVKTFISN